MSTNEPLQARENILGSRKTAGMVIGVLSILADIWLVSKMGTPSEIAIASLYMISALGLYSIGGQALVDSVSRWKDGAPQANVTESTTVNRKIEVAKP